MPGCHDMKKGEVYSCNECGFEFKVTKECKDVAKGAKACACSIDDEGCCEMTCCGEPMVKR
jgi:hypothetical protein